MLVRMYQDLTLWNNTPVIEEGTWRMLVPNNYGRKYRGIDYPAVVHQCPKDEVFRDATMTINAMRDEPKCDICHEVVPEDIQGLYKLYEFDRMAE